MGLDRVVEGVAVFGNDALGSGAAADALAENSSKVAKVYTLTVIGCIFHLGRVQVVRGDSSRHICMELWVRQQARSD